MQPRLRATLVIASIAVASAIAGAAIDRTLLVRSHRHGPRPAANDSLGRAAMRKEMLDHLDRDVSLTPAQRTAVDSIFQRTDSTMHAIRVEMQPRIQQALERSRADIAARLDSAQRVKFLKLDAERHARRHERP